MMEHHEHHPGQPAPTVDTTGRHGMLLFGDDPLYLSHLPMFHRPHNFQVLLEVQFDDGAQRALADDREANGDGMYTFDPDEFPIVELDPAGDGPARALIPGTIVRGHFERGGTPTATGAVAQVRDVVHFRELDIEAEPTPDRELTYLCFGRAGQLHLAHEITASPNFDQVLDVRLVPETVTDQAGHPAEAGAEQELVFRHAAPVRFFGRHDRPDDRLTNGETAGGLFFQSFGPGGSHGFLAQVEVVRELYLEIRELAGGA